MTTPQNPYGPQARPAQPYFPPQQHGPQAGYPRHAAPAPQGSWNPGPQQPNQASMSTGYPLPDGPSGFASQGPAQGYGPTGYRGQASAADTRQGVSAPAGLPQQGAAGVPAQRSGGQAHPQYPTGNGQPPKPPRNGLGTAALVLGILAVLFAMIPIVGMIAWPLSILGLIFGVIGVVRTRSGKADNKGVAISGTVLSAIGLILCIVWVAAFSNAVATTTPPAAGSLPASSGSGTTQAGGAFPGATSNDVVGNAGDTLTVGDMQISATALQPGDSTFGQKTLCTTVTYKNNGSTPDSFNGGFDWKLQDPAGAALMTGLVGSNNLLSAGQLAPGGTTSGDVCFDRSTSVSSGQHVLLYDPMTFSSTRGAWLNQVG